MPPMVMRVFLGATVLVGWGCFVFTLFLVANLAMESKAHAPFPTAQQMHDAP